MWDWLKRLFGKGGVTERQEPVLRAPRAGQGGLSDADLAGTGPDAARSDAGPSPFTDQMPSGGAGSASATSVAGGDEAALVQLVLDRLAGQAGVENPRYDPDADAIRLSRDGQETVLFLDNLARIVKNGDEAAINRALENLLAAPQVSVDGRILPVLKPADYIEQVRAQYADMGMTEDDAPVPFAERLDTGLMRVFVRDGERSMAILTAEDVDELGGPRAVLARAVSDLGDAVLDHPPQTEPVADGVFQVQIDGDYDASLYFLPEFWAGLAEDIGGPPAVLFAAKNIVAVANADDGAAMHVLTQIAAPDGEPPAYAIAPDRIYLWRPEGWALAPQTTTRVYH